MLIPIAGSGLTKADVAACLAKASATSFPGNALCHLSTEVYFRNKWTENEEGTG